MGGCKVVTCREVETPSPVVPFVKLATGKNVLSPRHRTQSCSVERVGTHLAPTRPLRGYFSAYPALQKARPSWVGRSSYVRQLETWVLLFGARGGQGVTRPVPDHIINADDLQRRWGVEPVVPGCSVAKLLDQKLEESLESSFMEVQPEEKQPLYLPIDKLYGILDLDSISSLVKERFPDAAHHELRCKVAEITGGGEGSLRGRCRRRILAILLYSNLLDRLEAFVRDDIWDEHLPLRRCSQTGKDCITWTTNRGGGTPTTSNYNNNNTTLFGGWGKNDLTLFYSYQPLFQVPFFNLQDDRVCRYELPVDARLPWASLERSGTGGSGAAEYRIQIHPSHHNYGPIPTR